MRQEPVTAATERETLIQYLDYQRETVLLKTDGLSLAQMAQALPTSTLTLAGLLYHLTLVEDAWTQVRFVGRAEVEPWASVDWEADRDWEFHAALAIEPEELRRLYRAAGDETRRTILEAPSLDERSVVANGDGEHFTLRWMILHLIEETARHAGHADLLREALDGTVGE